jgi:hypothetical protein
MLRRFFTILFLALLLPALLSCASGELVTMSNIDDLLKATLTSKGKREVIYEKWQGIGLEFTIKNISNFDISIPVEYIEKSGFGATIKNRETGQQIAIWPGLPLSEIVNPYTTLHPGEQLIVEGEIDRSYIEHFKQKYVDLDIEANISFEMKITNQLNDKLMYAILNDRISILDFEKPPAKN